MKQSVRFLTFLLCVSLFVSLIPLHSGADGATETTEAVEGKPYVGDGLIAWYDGGNNGNGIQNPMIDYWRDLTGNANHLDLRNMVSQNAIHWSDNALMVNPETGVSLAIPDSDQMRPENTGYTIELVLGEITYDATESVTLLSSDNGELSLGFDVEADGSLTLAYRHGAKNTQYPTVPNAEGYLGGYTLAVTSDAASADGTAEGRVTLYADGAELTSAQVGYSVDLDYLYVGLADPAHRFGGELHGLRIYERVLTPEELAANTEADRFNYRQGNRIDPVEQYGPTGPHPVPPLPPGCHSKRLVFSNVTDMIPLASFYGATNVLDYLYPYESDVYEGVAWEGARIMRSEEDETDREDGSRITDVRFSIPYAATCNHFGLEPITGKDATYTVFKMSVEGSVGEIRLRVEGVMEHAYDMIFDKDPTIAEQTFTVEDLHRGQDGELYLIMDNTDTYLHYLDYIKTLYMEIGDMDRLAEIYLKELMFCADADEVEEYTGISLSDFETTADTIADTTEDEDTVPETSESTTPQTDTPVKPSVTEPDTTGGEGTQRGCASAMGAGGVILLALGAAVIFRKQKE